MFHALRRQIRRNWRKPLVVMTPKSLLRTRESFSPLSDFTEGELPARDRRPRSVADSSVERVLLCTGKVYYDLAAARDEPARRRGDRPGRAALSLPRAAAAATRCRATPDGQAAVVGAGRAGEHGRLDLHASAPRGAVRRRRSISLRSRAARRAPARRPARPRATSSSKNRSSPSALRSARARASSRTRAPHGHRDSRPPMGESVTEGVIAEWLKSQGDAVEADEPVVEVETDKITVEVPPPLRACYVAGAATATRSRSATSSPRSSGVQRLRHRRVERARPEGRRRPAAGPSSTGPGEAAPQPRPRRRSRTRRGPRDASGPGRGRLRPASTRTVEGTGRGGRILKEDVQDQAAQPRADAAARAASPAPGDAAVAPRSARR